MANKFSAPRGTADILPEETLLWQDLEAKTRELMRVYGYREIRTPIFEETALFARSLGQSSDVVQKQMLNLAKNVSPGQESQEDGGLSLRPEGTASIVRSYIENSLDKKEGLSKLYYVGPMFRGERPQKGRLRQFHQIGVEVIGPNSFHPYLDAEVIALSVRILEQFGIKDFELRINSLGSNEDKRNFSTVLRERLKKDMGKLCPECQSRFERNVFRVLDCKNKECKAVVAKLDLGDAHLSKESKEYFGKVREALGSLKIRHTVSPQLVRGLDYYTHTVFEISHSELGSQDALGAGGRYNDLVQELGGSEGVGGIGFALGMERVLLAQPAAELKQSIDCFVVSLDAAGEKKASSEAFKFIEELRAKAVTADTSYAQGSMKSQMRAADKSGARYVIIIGEDELRDGKYTLKNMHSGDQEKLSFSEVLARLLKK